MKTKNNLKKIYKIQKPIEIDCHFKYRCPSPTCGYEHWISLKQAQTINFKIVCDCGTVFKPKRINTVTTIYVKKKPKIVEAPIVAPTVVKQESSEKAPPKIEQIPKGLLTQCTQTLLGYGFTKEESEKLIIGTFEQNQIKDCSLLIKTALQNLGVNKNG
jgi:hypothetical protein